jgi:coenzyme F420 hydrogenase subunit beta
MSDDAGIDAGTLSLFNQTCPGRRVIAPKPESPTALVHPTFGRAEAAWEAWATDKEIRYRGSSGGAITAMITWFLEQNPGATASGVAPSTTTPVRTSPVRLTTREEALQAAGSRYAPVSALAGLTAGAMPDVITAKPCEASALRQLTMATGQEPPFIFSFFCAGTPSQRATERLIAHLGMDETDVTDLRYRGQGWPGSFTATADKRTVSMPAASSWAEYFGRTLQSRCKVCVDATGEAADVACGDYWYTDENGEAVYDETDGRSVVIARSARGREFVERAIQAGVLLAKPLNLDLVTRVQLHQRERRQTLLARMIGRRLAGGKVPTYRGYHLGRRALHSPIQAVRALAGSVARGATRETFMSTYEPRNPG